MKLYATELAEYASKTNEEVLRKINQRWVSVYEALDLKNRKDFKVGDFVYESLLPHGNQVTLDGYIQNGDIDFFGFTKSVFMPNNISFKRFDFPFHFSHELSENIKKHAKQFIKAGELDDSMFNIEYKVDSSTGDFSVVEINTRASSQFMYPIQVVTGVHPLDVAIDISLGRKVEHAPQETKHKMCSVCVLRRPDDAKVISVPTEKDMQVIWHRFKEGKWNSFVSEGEKLSDYPNDSHTYRFAEVIIPHSDIIHVHDYEDFIVDKVTNMYQLQDL